MASNYWRPTPVLGRRKVMISVKTCLLMCLGVAAFTFSGGARAATCNVQVLRDIPSGSDHGPFKRGENEPAEYYEHGSFGAKGSVLVPRYIRSNGKLVEVARLTDCTIQKDGSLSPTDPHERAISLVQDKIYDRIRGDYESFPDIAGYQAGNIAFVYARQPDGQCAKLVDRALAHEPKAVAALNSVPAYCMQH